MIEGKKKLIMRFCGCDVILSCNNPEAELQTKYLERAEKEIKKIFDKEFHIPDKRELQKIVERDLGVKKHWLWGWIKA